jgi:hypothetical protein
LNHVIYVLFYQEPEISFIDKQLILLHENFPIKNE